MGRNTKRILSKKKTLHRGYTDMVAGPERTKMVFDHMFNKMNSKQIKQNFVEEQGIKVKKRNQKVKSVANNALRAVKLFMRKGAYKELDFGMIMNP